jgi:hypothetical protein
MINWRKSFANLAFDIIQHGKWFKRKNTLADIDLLPTRFLMQVSKCVIRKYNGYGGVYIHAATEASLELNK